MIRLLILTGIFFIGHGDLHCQELFRVEESFLKLGTTFKVISYVDDTSRWYDVLLECTETLDQIDRTFSDYRPDSESSKLSALSGSNQWTKVSEELWNLITYSSKISTLSKGAFDITIGPLSKMWRRAIRQQNMPSTTLVEELRKQVGYRNILIDSVGRKVRLQVTGMKLDFGGIAKGYAVDQIYEILLHAGYPRSLVDGGGDIYAGLPPPGEPGWKVQLGTEGKSLWLQSKGIASSGNTYKYLDYEGVRYSHIIDPATGLGVTHHDIIFVTADSCQEADALASAVSVLGVQNGNKLIKRIPGAEIR